MKRKIFRIEDSGKIGLSFGSSIVLDVITSTIYLQLWVVFQVRIWLFKDLVFAFIDKEGIISETAKYVDELAVINKDNNKVN